MENLEKIIVQPKELSFGKLHSILKPAELNELLNNKIVTTRFNKSDAWNAYGLSIRLNDFFRAKFEDGECKIVVQNIEDTEFCNVKEVTFIVEKN